MASGEARGYPTQLLGSRVPPDQLSARVDDLSGGQRRRLQHADAVVRANVLLLDEPTKT